jgi:hypothetical protein
MPRFAEHRLRALFFLLLVPLCACGPISYSLEVDAADRAVAAARSGNAIYYAPYEIYFAEAHLAKAREEASKGAYEDAIDLASVAEAYAKRALALGSRGGVAR